MARRKPMSKKVNGKHRRNTFFTDCQTRRADANVNANNENTKKAAKQNGQQHVELELVLAKHRQIGRERESLVRGKSTEES